MKLDRIVYLDERSRNFRAVAPLEGRDPRSYTWRVDTWLNQGEEGHCVAFGWAHELAARPVTITEFTDEKAHALFEEVRAEDQAMGNFWNEGASLLAGAKAVKNRGLIGGYSWAFGLDDLKLTVGYRGPVVLGINWHSGMITPDSDGFIRPTGPVLGGHAILCHAINLKKGYFTLWNSWGQDWGLNGRCRVSFEDMGQLLSAQGEAAIPNLRKR